MRRAVPLAGLLMSAYLAVPASAEDTLADEIVRALTGGSATAGPVTRSLGSRAPSANAVKLTPRSFKPVQSGNLLPTESPDTVKGTILIQPGAPDGERDPVIQAKTPTIDQPLVQGARPNPAGSPETAPALSYDLYVTFPFASHRLTDRAKDTLNSLATALNHPDLVDKRIRIAGHTDAVGTAESNMRLSERRAEEVRRFLWDVHKVDRMRIETVGYGESRLKDPARPRAGINRRVELVNLGPQPARLE